MSGVVRGRAMAETEPKRSPTRRQRPSRARPWITALLVCDRVLEEADRTNSLIRLVDRVIRDAPPPDAKPEERIFAIDVGVFLLCRAGEATGPLSAQIRLIDPQGHTIEVTPP